MAISFKSEVAALWLCGAAVTAWCLIPRRYLVAAVPLWMVASRLVARGATNRARPVSDADSADAQACARFVMSRDMPLAKRPVAIVTGTNSGIGYWTAVGLAVEGYEVVVTCRSAVLTRQTAELIRQEAERRRLAQPQRYAHSPASVLVEGHMPLECDDFSSVRVFAEWVAAKYAQRNVQVLVNNAGGMRKELGFSNFHPDLELHTAVNFLGPLLLTELLLPVLEKSGGRVVYVASEAHRFSQALLLPGRFSGWKAAGSFTSCNGLAEGKVLNALKEVNRGRDRASGPLQTPSMRHAFGRYGTSKLLNTYHAHVIAHRYAETKDEAHRVYACSLHPGCVVTNFSRDLLNGVANAIYVWLSLLFLKTAEEGAQTTLHCAMCPREELGLVAPSGEKPSASADAVSPYFVECADNSRSMLYAYGWDVSEAAAVVQWGRQLVGLA
ncbi:short chain dehydrogenase [Novymonas esmeraldas]|uniref:Short chain dehydrogenase n=1 Tax=Novymonas esmeraldas TaxID=1808958 RepID=A0AAW0EVR6_9TRYP